MTGHDERNTHRWLPATIYRRILHLDVANSTLNLSSVAMGPRNLSFLSEWPALGTRAIREYLEALDEEAWCAEGDSRECDLQG